MKRQARVHDNSDGVDSSTGLLSQVVRVFVSGPTFRSSRDDDLLQMAGLIAHALLKQEEEPFPRAAILSLHFVFGILDPALNRSASRTDR